MFSTKNQPNKNAQTKQKEATYIVISDGFPTNACSGIDLMLLLWNPLEVKQYCA